MFCTAASASTEQERQLEYSLKALDSVTTMSLWVGDIDGNWYTNVITPFVDGVVNSVIDLAWGPALYDVSAYWTDADGYPIFSSYGSIKKIESGMNYLDFPMYISYWRCITVQFKQPIASDSDLWVNGARAWYDGVSWRANVSAPWNMTELTVLWGGHGQWVLDTNPSYEYGQPIVLAEAEMDTSTTVPSQAFGISYLGETSYPANQAVFVSKIQYDESIGASVLVCYNTLYKTYGNFKLMITLEAYDPNLGNNVQYFSAYVDVQDGMFMIPLIDNNGGNLGIRMYTAVKFVYADPSDGGVCKQQWDYTVYQGDRYPKIKTLFTPRLVV